MSKTLNDFPNVDVRSKWKWICCVNCLKLLSRNLEILKRNCYKLAEWMNSLNALWIHWINGFTEWINPLSGRIVQMDEFPEWINWLNHGWIHWTDEFGEWMKELNVLIHWNADLLNSRNIRSVIDHLSSRLQLVSLWIRSAPNQVRQGQCCFANHLAKWGQASNPLCSCGAVQTKAHIVNVCAQHVSVADYYWLLISLVIKLATGWVAGHKTHKLETLSQVT